MEPTPMQAMKMNSMRVGTIVAERYRLEEPLVRGAMGTIWRAEHLRLKAPVAVKFLDPALITDQEMRGRFMQEARSTAAVRSAHVVQVFDHGIEEGFPFIVMELLEGESLDLRLADRGTLSLGELRKIFAEVARALGKAHALGVVHRDLKPANIFIAKEGPYEITKLVDFGIAKVKSEALQFTHVGTRMGTLLGTPQYMSPEQARGSCTVDFRTDLWALAIVACECLTGRCPFSGKTIGDLTVQICTERPTAPSLLGDVPPGFDAWFFKATHKTPSQRFGSIKEMEEALLPILAAGEARMAEPKRLRASNVWALPTRDQIRSVSSALLTRLQSQARGVIAFARNKADAWSWLLPEERRRILSVVALSVCGLTLLAVSNSQRQRPAPLIRATVSPAAVSPAAVSPAAVPEQAPRPAPRLLPSTATPPRHVHSPAPESSAREEPAPAPRAPARIEAEAARPGSDAPVKSAAPAVKSSSPAAVPHAASATPGAASTPHRTERASAGWPLAKSPYPPPKPTAASSAAIAKPAATKPTASLSPAAVSPAALSPTLGQVTAPIGIAASPAVASPLADRR